jgi:hypothetical protein
MNDMPIVMGSKDVIEALEDSCGKLKTTGPLSWEAVLMNGSSFGVCVNVDNGWMCIRSSLDAGHAPRNVQHLWHLCTHDAPGLVRFAMRQDSTVELRADLPLGALGPDDLRDCIGRTCRNLASARHFAACNVRGRDEAAAGPVQVLLTAEEHSAPAALEVLGDWADNTTWPHHRTASSCLAVDLQGVSGLYHRALLEDEAGGSLRMSVALGTVGRLPAASRAALALWILRVNAHTRMVRAAALDEGESTSVALETILEAPSARLVEETLRAIYSGCAVWGKGEVEALADPCTARTFLTVGDGPAAFVRALLPQDGTGKEEKQ